MGRSRPLDTAFAITLLTAAAYAIAFSFESGYLGHFGVPAAFAELIFRGLLFCAAAAGSFVTFGQGVFLLLPGDIPAALRNLLIRTGLSMAIVIMMLIAVRPNRASVLFMLGFFSLMILPDYI